MGPIIVRLLLYCLYTLNLYVGPIIVRLLLYCLHNLNLYVGPIIVRLLLYCLYTLNLYVGPIIVRLLLYCLYTLNLYVSPIIVQLLLYCLYTLIFHHTINILTPLRKRPFRNVISTKLFLALYMCIFILNGSPLAIFRTGFSLVEYCSGSFRPFLQSDY